MRLGTLAFLAGLILFHLQSELPRPAWGWLLPFAILAGIWRPRARLLACMMAGFCWALLWANPIHLQLPGELERADLIVEGWIASLPETFDRNIRFELAVDHLWHGDQPIPFAGNIRLSWYDDRPSTLQVGDRWRLGVRLRRPRGLMNPGGFDTERWLFVKNIAAQGTVSHSPPAALLARAERYPITRFRQALAQRFHEQLPTSPYTGILLALTVGDSQAISPSQWQVLSRTGTSHLISISGLHIGLVAALSFLLARKVWSWSSWLALAWPAPKAAALAALAAASAYALLAGWSVPTQRSLIMIAVVLLATLWQRHALSSRVLSLALLAVVIADPSAPLEGGFWLSFGAVAVIFYTLVGRYPQQPMNQWLGLQTAITVALIPLTLTLFQSISLLSPVANLIAIPWADVTVVPLALLAVLAGFVSDTLQALLLQLAALGMAWLWEFLAWLSRSSWALVYLPTPPLWTLAFALPGLMVLIGPRGLPGRWLGAIMCLPLVFARGAKLPDGALEFTLLDVGQGLAAVVRTRQHVVMFDSGPRLGPDFDAGKAVLLPFLRQQGIRHVDLLIASHADSEHTGGVRSLREQMRMDRILTSSLSATPITGAEPCEAGMTWHWDGVDFLILHPTADSGLEGNDASCVLLVRSPHGHILLTGDIEIAAQNRILKHWGEGLAAEILVAPHHGSRNLVSPAFIAAVHPRYALFSTGYHNRFGYPRAETLAVYRKADIPVLNTAELGAISFILKDGGTLEPHSYRHEHRRYWHTP